MNTLNENIKEYRRQFGMSQVDLAQALHVSKQCVSNWENDNVQPSIEMLLRMADYFRVSTDALLGRVPASTLDISDLTGEQAAHIRLLVKDLVSRKRGN